jgi:hypothetical protein
MKVRKMLKVSGLTVKDLLTYLLHHLTRSPTDQRPSKRRRSGGSAVGEKKAGDAMLGTHVRNSMPPRARPDDMPSTHAT